MKSAAAGNLSKEQFAILENNSALVNFKKGEMIFKQNALSLNVTYLKEGIVKLHITRDSKEKILRIVKAPAYLGIPTNIGQKINQFSATALVHTTVCFIDCETFKDFIHNNGNFAFEIIAELCRNELADYQRYVSIAYKQVPGMVAETLLCLSEKIFDSEHFILPLTRGEIGDLIGTSRESVSRVLTELANEKIITLNNNDIKINNINLLKQISEKG